MQVRSIVMSSTGPATAARCCVGPQVLVLLLYHNLPKLLGANQLSNTHFYKHLYFV